MFAKIAEKFMDFIFQYGFYFLVREAKLLKYFRLITNYFLDFVRDKNLKERMSCFFTMKDRCLNYLACNRDIHALFPLSWLSYSAFHDASSSNFDGKLDWKFFRFSVRSLQPLFHFLIKVHTSYFSLTLSSLSPNFISKQALRKCSLR